MATTSESGRDVVLVVDDDPAVLASLKFALEVEGFSVETARAADEVLGRARRDIACIVVDFHLPGPDGLEVVSALRSSGIDSPAILITSNPPASVRRRAERGNLTIVEKPLLGNTLAEAIYAALGAGHRGGGPA